MQITRQTTFRPVTIVLETQEELDGVTAALGEASNGAIEEELENNYEGYKGDGIRTESAVEATDILYRELREFSAREF